jgi:rRNA processing protein Krr1/Pno1
MKKRISLALKSKPNDKRLVVFDGSQIDELIEIGQIKFGANKLNAVCKLNGLEVCSVDSIVNGEVLHFFFDIYKGNQKNSSVLSTEDLAPELCDATDSCEVSGKNVSCKIDTHSSDSLSSAPRPVLKGDWSMLRQTSTVPLVLLPVAPEVMRFLHTKHSWHRALERKISTVDINMTIKNGKRSRVGGGVAKCTLDNTVVLVKTKTNQVVSCWSTRSIDPDNVETMSSLQEIVNNKNAQLEVIRDVQDSKPGIVGKLIGRSGSMMNGIIRKTGIKMDIVNEHVILSGTWTAIETATTFVDDIIDGKGDHTNLDVLGLHTVRLLWEAIEQPIFYNLVPKFNLVQASFEYDTDTGDTYFVLVGTAAAVRIAQREVEARMTTGCGLGEHIYLRECPGINKFRFNRVIFKNERFCLVLIRNLFPSIKSIRIFNESWKVVGQSAADANTVLNILESLVKLRCSDSDFVVEAKDLINKAYRQHDKAMQPKCTVIDEKRERLQAKEERSRGMVPTKIERIP